MKKALILLAMLCLSLALAAEEPPPAARLAFEILQPEYLSAASDTTVRYTLSSPVSGPAQLAVRLVTDDELLDAEILRQTFEVRQGQHAYAFVLPPQAFASVNHGEDVMLVAKLVLPDGRTLEADADATVLAGPAPEGGSWAITLASKPALIYTSRDTILHYTITNPKANSKKVGLYLKFMNDHKKKKVVYQTIEYPQPGVSDVPVTVPSSVATQARSKGDTLLKTVLKVEGIVKKRDQALLDYDFTANASADPVQGDAPLLVRFTGDATGGKIPYAYNWIFGDGGTSSDQNPVHTYTTAGIFDAQLAVSDSLGATVGASAQVAVTLPPLTVACGASPTSGTAPLDVNFTCTPAGGVGSYAYSWTFGDGGTSTQQNPTHRYTTGGASYAATVTVTSGTETKACTTPAITVNNPALSVTCEATPTTGTAPLTVAFKCTPSGGTGTYTYSWKFGDGGTSTSQNPTHAYIAGGASYAAQVTVTSGSDSVTCTTPTITVNWPELVVACTGTPTSGAAPLTVSFTCSASGGTGSYTYDWNWGDGTTHGTSQNGNHAYTTAGSYVPTVTVTSGSQSKTCGPPTITVTAP
jgi:PKD repeat protein